MYALVKQNDNKLSSNTHTQNLHRCQNLEEIKAPRLTEKLRQKGSTSLRSVNGSLQHMSSERPDALCKNATSQENMNDITNQTWQSVHKAYQILEKVENTNDRCSSWYPNFNSTPPTPGYVKQFKLTLMTDSALKNLSLRY